MWISLSVLMENKVLGLTEEQRKITSEAAEDQVVGLPGRALYRIQGTHRLEMVMQDAGNLSLLVRTLWSLELCGFLIEHASEHRESSLHRRSLGSTPSFRLRRSGWS